MAQAEPVDDEGVEGVEEDDQDDQGDQGIEYVSKQFGCVNLSRKVPPKRKAEGFMAEDWSKEYAQYTACILKVISSKQGAILQFSLKDKPDDIFLRFEVNEDENKIATIESCTDSSRYFVLNVPVPQSQNKYATMGIFFDERDDGRDFMLEVNGIRDYVTKSKEAKKRNKESDQVKESQEFTLSQTEQLKIKPFKNPHKNKSDKQDTSKETSNTGLFDLAPPKTDTKSTSNKKKEQSKPQEAQKTTENPNKAQQNDDELFGDDNWEF